MLFQIVSSIINIKAYDYFVLLLLKNVDEVGIHRGLSCLENTNTFDFCNIFCICLYFVSYKHFKN